MYIDWSSIVGLPVRSTDSEQNLGHVSAAFVNPDNGQMMAFLIGMGRVLALVDIQQWTKDALIVGSREALVAPQDIQRLQTFGIRKCLLNRKKVRSKSKRNLGRVRDFTIDTSTNSLVRIMVGKKLLVWEFQKRIFPEQEISEITESAVILRLEPESPTPKGGKRVVQPT